MRLLTPVRFVTASLLAASLALSFAKNAQPSVAEQVNKLVVILKSDAPQKEKADACRELARIGTKAAVAPLAALLGDENLSHMARYGLETIPDNSVDKALRAALGQLHGRPLVGVIGTIGVRRDSKAVKSLASLLHDQDPEVVQAAARALGQIGTRSAAQALESSLGTTSPASQLALYEGLFRCAETLADQGDRKDALRIYDRSRALDAPHQVRAAALRGAILCRRQDGLPLLLQALSTEDFAQFAASMRVAQELPGSNVTSALATQLQGLPPDKQILLIQTLGNRADRAALPALFAAARKGTTDTRSAAIAALPAIGSPAAVPVLIGLLGDNDAQVARAAQESLGAIPGPEADAAIMLMFARSDVSRRITAMDLIVRRRMTVAIPRLFAAAEDREPKIRVAAIRRLGELAGPSDIPTLLHLLNNAKYPEDIEATEQALSVVSLKANNPEACAAEVAGRFAASRPAQQCALLHVLAVLGGTNALKTVRLGIHSHEGEVHAAAIRALSTWTTADAAPVLLEWARRGDASTDQMLCVRGYLRLAAQTELPADKRLSMCSEVVALVRRDDQKRLLLAALGNIPSLQSLAMVKPFLDDAAVAEEARTASVNIAEKLLQGSGAAASVPQLVGPLETVAQTASKAELANRAKSLLAQAREKSASKSPQ